MKYQVALLLLGVVALSSANGFRKTLQQVPIQNKFRQHHHAGAGGQGGALNGAGSPGLPRDAVLDTPLPVELPMQGVAFGAGAPGAGFGAGAPALGAGGAGSVFGAGAPGAPGFEEIVEVPHHQPAQVHYKAPTRIVDRAPIRVAAPTSTYSRGGAGGAGGDDVPAPPPKRAHGGAAAAKKPHHQINEEEVNLDQEYARNAHYSFASAVDDGIQDQSHIRQETREGLKVTGTYAYSDGYFKRTVQYEADENGYRVVGENVEPLGEDGPQIDLVNGKAEVHTQIGGVDTQYSVSADELALNTKKANTLLTKE